MDPYVPPSFQMPYQTVILKEMRAVGMHHWGPPILLVNEPYTLKWEPECPHDPGNAMAIYDPDHIKKAYITRTDAKILSHIWSKDLVINHMMICIPYTKAHCVCYDLGPQHECDIKFRVNVSDIERVKHFLTLYQCEFEIH